MDVPGELTTRDGAPYEVTPEGSLGLLALGDVGLAVWRQVRQKASREGADERNDGEHAATGKGGDAG